MLVLRMHLNVFSAVNYLSFRGKNSYPFLSVVGYYKSNPEFNFFSLENFPEAYCNEMFHAL